MHGLISQYSVAVIPIVLGGGIPLFAAVEGQQSLKLVEAKTYPDGIVMLTTSLMSDERSGAIARHHRGE